MSYLRKTRVKQCMDIEKEKCIYKEKAVSCGKCCAMSPKMSKEQMLDQQLVVSSMEVTETTIWKRGDGSLQMKWDEEGRGVRKYI